MATDTIEERLHQYGVQIIPGLGLLNIRLSSTSSEYLTDLATTLRQQQEACSVEVNDILVKASCSNNNTSNDQSSYRETPPKDEDLLALFEALVSLYPELNFLTIKLPIVPVTLLASLLAHNGCKIKKLSLRKVLLTGTESDFDKTEAALGLNTSLICLDFDECCQLQQAERLSYSLDFLLRGLASIPTLEEVLVSSSNSQLRRFASLSLQSLVTSCRCSLKTLVLKNLKIEQEDIEALSTKESTSSLKNLSLGPSCRGMDSALSLLLRSSKTLERLVLHELDHCTEIAKALQTTNTSSLRHLTIYGNMDVQGRLALIEMIESNCMLENLWFENRGHYRSKIKFYLKLNRLGHRRSFLAVQDEQKTDEEWIQLLLSCQNDFSVFYYYITVCPLLRRTFGNS